MSPRHANVAIFVPHLGCPHDCSFCNQRSISGYQRPPLPEEVAETARQALGQLGPAAQNAEIAFFGGSFTAIEPALMQALLAAAAPFVGPGGFHGIRVSTRPDAVDKAVLGTLKQYGVTAIELGAQSMDDRVLALNGRGHSVRDVENASRLIQAAGFELGLQMMTGLYGDTSEGAVKTAGALAALGPATVRIYPTIVLRGTALERLYREGRYAAQPLDGAVGLCAGLLEFFLGRGIRVIRLGLHASEGIEEAYVAGPWHPAFRELCEGRIYLRAARRALAEGRFEGGAALLVAPRGVSKLAGQKRANLNLLAAETGLRLRIRPAELPEWEVRAAAL